MIPQPATGGPVQPTAPAKLPGRAGIWIGVLTIIAGIVLGIVLVVVGAQQLFDGFDDMQRVPIGQGGTVQIDEVGTQSIYAERPAPGTGTGWSSSTTTFGFRPDIEVLVTDPNGQSVTVVPASSEETYTFDERRGVLIGKFEAEQPGTYTVRSITSDGGGQYTTLAVGEFFDVGGVFGILGGILGGGALVLLGIILVVVFSIRRSRARKRQAGYGGYGGYGGSGGTPLPGWAPAPGYAGAPGYPPPGYGPPGYAPPTAPPGGPRPGGWPQPPQPAPPAAPPGWAPPPATSWQPPPPPSGPVAEPPVDPTRVAPPDEPTSPIS